MAVTSLGSTSLFSGSYSLTTSLASIGASSYDLDPADWSLPSGYSRRQYRYTFTFGSNTSNPADYMEGWEYRGSASYAVGGIVNRAGWAGSSGMLYTLKSSGTVSTGSSPDGAFGNAASLGGSGNLQSEETLDFGTLAKPFCVECMFQRSRTTAGVETLCSIWNTTGLFVTYFSNDILTVTNETGTVANGSSTGTGGTHWFAYSWDGTTARAYLDGTRFMNQTHTPTPSSNFLEIGSNDVGSNRFQGLVDEVRVSVFDARYTGSSYTVPTAPFTRDGYTLGLWHLDSAPSAAPSVVTDWVEFPASSVSCDLYGRNRTAARGVLTDVLLEVRAVT